MTKYWFFITDEKNWKIIKQKNIYAVKEKHFKKFNKVSLNDIVIFYITGKMIGGIFSIKSKEDNNKILFGEYGYKHKFNLNKILVSQEPLRVKRELIDKISVFKNLGDRWDVILMGRPIVELNKKDVETIHEAIN